MPIQLSKHLAGCFPFCPSFYDFSGKSFDEMTFLFYQRHVY